MVTYQVVQHGRKVRVNIQKTQHKGWGEHQCLQSKDVPAGLTLHIGIFAGERIPAHTFIGIYAGEYLTNDEGHVRGT